MATIYYRPKNKPLAQELRREMTRHERHLWYDCLKQLPLTVKRQKQFGNYIVDFYCANQKLIIELDGSQHYDPDAAAYDAARDDYLRSLGLRVLRFSNADVDTHFDAVCQTIWRELGL